jgi:peptidoglycan/xylan/chitin deacetylase (PgdA/CDA1 family)
VGATDKGFWWDECYFLLRELERRPEVLDDILTRLGHADLVRRFAAAGRDIVFLVGEMQSVPERDRRSVLDALWDETDAQRATVLQHNATADWPTIRRAAADGMSFGSHTCSHMFLHCADPHSARDELRRSKLEIERQLDRPVQAFAYPGGRLTPETARWVEEAGYGCAVTTAAGVNQAADSPFTLKRISIWNGTVTGPSGRFSPAKLAVNLLALRRPA